jgi:hypothetical protein
LFLLFGPAGAFNYVTDANGCCPQKLRSRQFAAT